MGDNIYDYKLTDNDFGEEGVEALSETLKNNSTLTSLILESDE